MIELESVTNTQWYDCLECGEKNSVIIQGSYGICKTLGCIHNDLVQFLYTPNWSKPKAGLAGREIFWHKITPPNRMRRG